MQFVDPAAPVTQSVEESIKAKQAELKTQKMKDSGSRLRRFLVPRHLKPLAPPPQPPSAAAATEGTAQTSVKCQRGIALDGIPVHPHVYGNGHICLDLLGAGWSPVHTITSVALSLQSMLAGNDKYGKFGLSTCKILLTSVERPPDNNRYVVQAPLNPNESQYVFVSQADSH